MKEYLLFVAVTVVALGGTVVWASTDWDGTVWMYEADGSDYAGLGNTGNNETTDVDGTIINGWDLYTSGGGHTAGVNVEDPANYWDLDTFGKNTPMPGVISYALEAPAYPVGRGGFGRDATRGKMNADDITPNTGFTYEWQMACHYPSNGTTEHIFVQVDTGVIFDRAYEIIKSLPLNNIVEQNLITLCTPSFE